MKEITNAYNVSVGKHKGKKPVGRRKHSWVLKIKVHFKEIKQRLDSTGSGHGPGVVCFENALHSTVSFILWCLIKHRAVIAQSV
jgi:hypothetical protein